VLTRFRICNWSSIKLRILTLEHRKLGTSGCVETVAGEGEGVGVEGGGNGRGWVIAAGWII